jgi:predicted metal-dependent phosphoesterase TrpH
MKIDFHTHTKLGKKMPFSKIYTDGNLREARQAGLDAICLTEHYNGTDLIQSFEYISSIMERQGDCYVSNNAENETLGLKIFLGMEVNAQEGGHFLVIGSLDDVQSIYGKLGVYLQNKEHPPFEKLLEIVKMYNILFGVSHPYRENSKGNNMPDLPEEQLKQLDFIDLNGKDCAYDKEGTEAKVHALSLRLGIPYLAGSDTHQSFQFGCIFTQFDKPLTTIDELKKAVKKGKYTIKYGKSALMQVTAAGIIKRTLKEIHELGGDYVSVLFEDN